MTKKKIFIGIALAFVVGIIYAGLSVEPSNFIKNSHIGWVIVRLIALILAVIPSIITYFGVDFNKTMEELKAEAGYVDGKLPDGLPGLSGVKWIFASAPMISWILSWILAFQIMVSFYISEWCKYGI